MSRMTMPTMLRRKFRFARRALPLGGARPAPSAAWAMTARPTTAGRMRLSSAEAEAGRGAPPRATPGDMRLPTTDSRAVVHATNLCRRTRGTAPPCGATLVAVRSDEFPEGAPSVHQPCHASHSAEVYPRDGHQRGEGRVGGGRVGPVRGACTGRAPLEGCGLRERQSRQAGEGRRRTWPYWGT